MKQLAVISLLVIVEVAFFLNLYRYVKFRRIRAATRLAMEIALHQTKERMSTEKITNRLAVRRLYQDCLAALLSKRYNFEVELIDCVNSSNLRFFVRVRNIVPFENTSLLVRDESGIYETI